MGGFMASQLDAATDVFDFARAQLDRTIKPATRQRIYSSVAGHASQQPLLASFICVQAAVCLVPLLLFTSFLVATLLFAATAAVLFVLFWTALAALVLAPVLGGALMLGVGLWLWAVAALLAARWAYGVAAANRNSSGGGISSSGRGSSSGSNASSSRHGEVGAANGDIEAVGAGARARRDEKGDGQRLVVLEIKEDHV